MSFNEVVEYNLLSLKALSIHNIWERNVQQFVWKEQNEQQNAMRQQSVNRRTYVVEPSAIFVNSKLNFVTDRRHHIATYRLFFGCVVKSTQEHTKLHKCQPNNHCIKSCPWFPNVPTVGNVPDYNTNNSTNRQVKWQHYVVVTFMTKCCGLLTNPLFCRDTYQQVQSSNFWNCQRLKGPIYHGPCVHASEARLGD